MIGVGERCEKHREGATSKTIGRRLPYTMERITYNGRLGTQGTNPVRQVKIGEDAEDGVLLATYNFPKSAKNDDSVEIPDSRGVWGQEVPREMPAIDPQRPLYPSSTTTNSGL